MRTVLIVVWMLMWSTTAAVAQVSGGISFPGLSIGINVPVYPELIPVPGYPVYYAPSVNSNYFFYDGMYWVYHGDNWYASSWYNGPWGRVAPAVVPLFVLRIPVRYYRAPPEYFRRWQPDGPPRWGEHWGNDWERRRSGWDRWDRRSVPAPAPLPVYQRQYSRDRYPQLEQQHRLHNENYRYQPRDQVVRKHYQEQAQGARPPSQRQEPSAPQERSPRQQDQRSGPPPQGGQGASRAQPPQKGGEDAQRSAPTKAPPQQKGQAREDQKQQSQREQQSPRSNRESPQQGKGASQEPGRGQGQEKGREKGDERGQERNK